jgi:diguanylate cyclase (GGDEF)-like protein/PAS domain S-box-containing protein
MAGQRGWGRFRQNLSDSGENRQTQAATLHSEAKYRAVVETSPDAVWMIDEELNYTFINRRFLEMVGADGSQAIIGSSCLRFVQPAQRKRSERILRGLLRHIHILPPSQLGHLDLGGQPFEAEVRLSRSIDPSTGRPAVLGITRDTSERAQAETALRYSEARYRSLFEGIPMGLYRTDSSGRILEANRTLLHMLGYERLEDLRQVSPAQLYPDSRDQSPRSGPTQRHELRLRRRDGRIFWAEDHSNPVTDSGGLRYYEGSLQDITERKAYQAQIEHLAYHDALTGLPNRRLLREQSESLIAQADRAGREAALIYFDLDHFKEINDTLGHDAGDLLLRQVAVRVGTIIRAGDIFSRLGGDEFAILLADAGETGAAEAARRVLEVLREPIRIAGESVRISSSIGIALMPRDGSNLESLMRAADIAMYRAKGQRGSFAFYSLDADPYTRERLQLISELREAIHHDRMMLHYQPILDLQSRKMHRVEALCRWPHPVRGMISPGVFIPLAEETNLIDDLDYYVLRKAVGELVGSGLEINVNLSARTLHDPLLVERVERILKQSGCPPQRLWLEITETALMTNLEQAASHIRSLKKLGIRLALDDFGTGYSSMAYIKHLDLDVIKLDRVFVKGIGQDSRDESVIKAIVSLSEGLNLRVLAEGVETAEQLLWLEHNGCELAQGYHIAKPMSRGKLVEFLGAEVGIGGRR